MVIKTYAFLLLISMHGLGMAQTSGGTMSDAAKAGQRMKNPLYPQVQLPLTYNLNPRMGISDGVQQTELTFNPVIPVDITKSVQVILNPMLTFNHYTNDQQITNQNQPFQLATYFAPTFVSDWCYGIGPYIQAPASNSNNGSRQTGLGVSAGLFYSPGNWVIGTSVYNSWDIGNDLSGGSANLINVQPIISFTTDHAWTYSLSSQINYNYTARNATNQLTLSGGKTIRIAGHHLQFQVGPTYMVTTTPFSSKGFGAYFGVTALMPK